MADYFRYFSLILFCTDGTDFISKVHTVTFDAVGTLNSTSSQACVTILDDRISEATESFICVILRPRGLDGIVVEDPITLSFAICDDDRTYYVYVYIYCVLHDIPLSWPYIL